MAAIDRVHSPTSEELMAYLDGESPAGSRAAIEKHIASCPECQSLAADLRALSDNVAAWTWDNAPATLGLPRASDARRRHWPVFAWRPVYAMASFGAVAVAIIFAAKLAPPDPGTAAGRDGFGGFAGARNASAYPEAKRSAGRGNANNVNGSVAGASDRLTPLGPAKAAGGGSGSSISAPAAAAQMVPETAEARATPRQPLVIRTATLRLVANDFNAARRAVETIVAGAQGFIDQITTTGAAGSARALTGTLRVPVPRLADTLGQLRHLGQVTEDTQASEDVTDQIVDLDARLANLRATEQRLDDILKNRTGKLSDVLDVERELARVRLDIERMDAERTNVGRRVAYAAITIEINEERKAGLESGPLALSTRLRVAAADGLESALESVVGGVLLILRAGPAAILWLSAAALLWFTLRRFRIRDLRFRMRDS
jgi:anti-sigma factor RsiW